MTKRIQFPFKDGVKEIGIGDEAFELSPHRQSASWTIKVTAIGRKYVTFGVNQYHIDSGAMKTEFTGNTIYSSEAAYATTMINSVYSHELTMKLYYSQKKFTKEQVMEAAKILGIDQDVQDAVVKKIEGRERRR